MAGEVGYEVLYWIPFLRWLQDRHQVGRDRLVALSRGGLEHLYQDMAAGYVDIFDDLSPSQLAARNEARQQAQEAGGRKQTSPVASSTPSCCAWREPGRRSANAAVLHPSLMFRLFRETWHGNLPLDILWTHTDYATLPPAAASEFHGLGGRYIAVRFYSGVALRHTDATRAALRALVASVACHTPVVVLDAGLGVDDHTDFLLRTSPTSSARATGWRSQQPRRPGRADRACRLLSRHLRRSGLGGAFHGRADRRRVRGRQVPVAASADRAPGRAASRCAEFTTLDLRALSRFTVWQRD